MILHENLTFYDILDVPPNASPQDVREAYLRTKGTFNRDSVALYTIITPEEREETLKKIEEAYYILSNPERRRQYDQSYGFLSPIENPFSNMEEGTSNVSSSNGSASVVSIDRVPPMETLQDSESLLIPPVTDFTQTRRAPSPPTQEVRPASSFTPPPAPMPKPPPSASDGHLRSFPGFRETRTPMPTLDPVLFHAIEMETEWRGSFLKKVREAYRISLEEMAGITKVTKTYILAIEDENYAKLPAPVYIRGFITQMAKVLKLPYDRVASAYLTRYFRNQPK